MTETFDKPPAGWFALDVMKKRERKSITRETNSAATDVGYGAAMSGR